MLNARIFTASTQESAPAAEALSALLERRGLESTAWTDSFKPASFTMETLTRVVDSNCYAAFFFSASDLALIRGTPQSVVRDNLIFEAGLFIGKHGHKHCFVLVPESVRGDSGFHLPSDFNGFTWLFYREPTNKGSRSEWSDNLSNVATNLVEAIDRTEKEDAINVGPSTSPSAPSVYPSVAAARLDISRDIRRLANSAGTRLLVQVIGYRLRGVRDLLQELFDYTANCIEPVSNVHFKVFYVDPDYLEAFPDSLALEDETVRENLRIVLQDQVAQVRSNLRDLQRFNDPEFQDLGLSCELIPYNESATTCTYIIGREVAYLGTFIWNDKTGDFSGPKCPCYRFSRDQPVSSRTIDWCLARAELLASFARARETVLA